MVKYTWRIYPRNKQTQAFKAHGGVINAVVSVKQLMQMMMFYPDAKVVHRHNNIIAALVNERKTRVKH